MIKQQQHTDEGIYIYINVFIAYLCNNTCPGGASGKDSACQCRKRGFIPEFGRFPGVENGNPLQHSCLENPMDRRVWQAIVHGVAESDMTEQLSTHAHIFIIRTFHMRYHNPHSIERNEFRKAKWCAQRLQYYREGQSCELNASIPRSVFPLWQYSDLPTNFLFSRDSSHSSWPHPVLQPFVIPTVLPNVFTAPFPAPSSQFHVPRRPCLGS